MRDGGPGEHDPGLMQPGPRGPQGYGAACLPTLPPPTTTTSDAPSAGSCAISNSSLPRADRRLSCQHRTHPHPPPDNPRGLGPGIDVLATTLVEHSWGLWLVSSFRQHTEIMAEAAARGDPLDESVRMLTVCSGTRTGASKIVV